MRLRESAALGGQWPRVSTMALGGLAGLIAFSCSAGQTPRPESADPVLDAGRDIYIRNCTSCHGAAGGGGRGPKLNEGRLVGGFPDQSDQVDFVSEGNGGMPAFSGRLTPEEIESVVRFTREVL